MLAVTQSAIHSIWLIIRVRSPLELGFDPSFSLGFDPRLSLGSIPTTAWMELLEAPNRL